VRCGRDEFRNVPDDIASESTDAQASLTTDRQRAIAKLLPLAEAGFVPAMVNLASAYSSERPNYKNEKHWYTRAYRAGSREAAYRLGCLYFALKDFSRAKELFEECSAFDDIPAKYWLGRIYLFEMRRFPQASALLAEARARGHLGAELLLAQARFHGKFGFLPRFPAMVGVLVATWKMAKVKAATPDVCFDCYPFT
jgi:TPR repeat protein